MPSSTDSPPAEEATSPAELRPPRRVAADRPLRGDFEYRNSQRRAAIRVAPAEDGDSF